MEYSIFNFSFIGTLVAVLSVFLIISNPMGLIIRDKFKFETKNTFIIGALIYLAVMWIGAVPFGLLGLPFKWYFVTFSLSSMLLIGFSVYTLFESETKINIIDWFKENWLVIAGVVAIAGLFLLNNVYTFGWSSELTTFMDEYYRNLIAMSNMATNLGALDPRTGLEIGA